MASDGTLAQDVCVVAYIPEEMARKDSCHRVNAAEKICSTAAAVLLHHAFPLTHRTKRTLVTALVSAGDFERKSVGS